MQKRSAKAPESLFFHSLVGPPERRWPIRNPLVLLNLLELFFELIYDSPFIGWGYLLDELEALVILAGMPHLGSIKIRVLLSQFGTASDVLNTDPKLIAELPGFGPKIMQGWDSWANNGSWKLNLELARKYRADIIPYTSPLYPKSLLEIHDLPILLYVKGQLKNIDRRSIAIVGTRNAGIYGMEAAEMISQDLASKGFTIVSGLARGIDTAAHQGALKAGRTIAVIGSGLADIYPRENCALAERIASQGAVISEFQMATPPDRQNFPQRNRIVSGMTMGTLLIEAPVKSGAMITMNRALAQGKRLYALPGRADWDNFKGNHHLIKTGQARLIEDADDIANEFEDFFGAASPIIVEGPKLEKDEIDFLNLMPNEELCVEDLACLTKLPMMKLNVLLMSLTLKKVIREYPGKVYKKCRK